MDGEREKRQDEREKCDLCGRPAIGLQVMGCCGYRVCEDHADPRLRDLEPGGRLEWGGCYFMRFG
ncbi:MAG: hypothetical protein QFX32_02350 [Methanolinea sp.]|nr:hypothetical protein [Methanolinea sp.]